MCKQKLPYLDSETLKNVCCGTAISTICYGTFLNFETPWLTVCWKLRIHLRQWTVNRIYGIGHTVNKINGSGRFIKFTAMDGVSNLHQWTVYQIYGSGRCIKFMAMDIKSNLPQWTVYKIKGSGRFIKFTAIDSVSNLQQ